MERQRGLRSSAFDRCCARETHRTEGCSRKSPCSEVDATILSMCRHLCQHRPHMCAQPSCPEGARSTTASQRPQGTQSEPTALSCSRRWGRHSAEQIQNRLDTRGSAAINAPGRWGGWRSRRCARCWGAPAPGPAPPPVPARRWRRRPARWCGGLPVFQKLAQLRLN